MRAFVALEVPDEKVLDSIQSFQRELGSTGADLKLVARENLHFTVKFLGEISAAQAKEADMRLNAVELKGGEVDVEGVGAFPSPSRPSVVWVGISPAHEDFVVSTANRAISALDGIGETDRRPFRPHLTLARVRSPRNLSLLSGMIRENRGRSFGKTELRTIKLKSSTLTTRGPVYSDIGVYHLT